MSFLGKIYLFFEKIVVYKGMLDRPACIEACSGHLPDLANIDGLFQQINLTKYEFSFHVNAEYDFDVQSWMWGSGSTVDNHLWFHHDGEYYPKNHDIIQLVYDVCEGDGTFEVGGSQFLYV